MSTYNDLLEMNAAGTNTYNWATLPTVGSGSTIYAQAISPISGVYYLNYAFLTSGDISAGSVNYQLPGGPSSGSYYYSNYYSTYFGGDYVTDFGSALTPDVKTAVETILAPSGTTYGTDYFADVAKLAFTHDSDTTSVVQIQIGTNSDANGEFYSKVVSGVTYYAYADTANEDNSLYNPAVFGDIWLDTGQTRINWATDTVAPGSHAFTVLLHELGHDMGLQHPPDGSTLNSPYYTVMTGTADGLPGLSGVFLTGLQMDDILAVQSIYGANYATRDTSSLYGLGWGFGDLGSTTPAKFAYTIWDGGGTNIIDASSYSGRSIVNLNEGAFSSIGPADTGNTGDWNKNEDNYGSSFDGIAYQNVAIAYGAIIQNAIGSQGASILIGNQWNNVLAGAPGYSGNTFYSDGTLDGFTQIDWSHNGSSSTVGTLWTDPNYITPAPNTSSGSMKEDVLIGDGASNTFYSGIGNTVIDGGYNKTDIDSATAAINTSWGDSGSPNYWDYAGQFTGTNNIAGAALTSVSDSSAYGNVVNYSKLYLDVSGSPGIIVTRSSATDADGKPIYTVVKGASGVGGTDTLIDVQGIVGTGAHDVFASPGAGNYMYYFEAAGHPVYILAMNSDSGGDIGIVDTSGQGTMVVQGSVADQITSISASLFTGGSPIFSGSSDNFLLLSVSDGVSTNDIYVDATSITSSSGVNTLEIGGHTMSAASLVSYLSTNGNIIFATPSEFDSDVNGGGGGGGPSGMPTPVYDPTTGQMSGMISPAYDAGTGDFVDRTLGYGIDHPMVITAYAEGGGLNMTLQTFIQSAVMHEPASDFRIVWDGPTGDNLTVYDDSAGKSFSIPHFTAGVEIIGYAVMNDSTFDTFAPYLTSLSATSAGNYSALFSGGSLVVTSVDVTYFFEQMGFSDGTVWNLQTGGTTFTGSDGQTLYARDAFNDTLVAGGSSEYMYGSTGDTTMVAGPGSIMYNGTGSDVDVFSAGKAPVSGGGDHIQENASGGTVTIAFHGIDPSAVTLADNSYGYLTVNYSSTDQITVVGGTVDSSGFTLGSLQHITFDDSGSTNWNTSAGLNLTATSDGQSLFGTSSGGDTLTADGTGDYLTAYAGTETLVAGAGSTLYNGTGTDTDVFSTGKAPISGGGDYIVENTGTGTATIAFHGIDPSAVTMWDDAYGYFVVHYSSTDQITVVGGTLDSSGFTLGSLQHVTFDDSGSTNWDLTGGLNLTAASDGQSIYGTSSGGDTLTALGVGDTLTAYAGTENLVAGVGSTLYNGTGTDTDVFSAGKAPISGGGDYLVEGTGTGTIAFHGIDPSAVTMWDNSYGYFVVHYSSTDQIIVVGGTLDYSTGFALGSLTGITFDDTAHTTVDLTGSLNQTAISDSQSIYGSGHGDTMTALGDGDTLNGIAGNNTMIGHTSGTTYFLAGSGDDVMVGMGGTNYMTAGSGTDTVKIDDASSSTYVSSFGTGDKLDFADILTPVYDPVHDALGNFVQEATSGGNTTFSVDTTGTATFTAPLVTLSGVTGLDDVATLVANGHLIVHS